MSLIEVLVASLLMIVGIVTVLAVFPQSLGTARKSARILVLNRLATEKLESLRALDYDHADLASGVHPAQQIDSNGDRYYSVPGFPQDYSLRWSVQAGPTDGSGTAEPNMKTIVVEATHWVRYSGAGVPLLNDGSLSTRYQTFIARPE